MRLTNEQRASEIEKRTREIATLRAEIVAIHKRIEVLRAERERIEDGEDISEARKNDESDKQGR